MGRARTSPSLAVPSAFMRTDTSTSSTASTNRKSQQPTSAAAAGSASVPPPMVVPAMRTMVATVALQNNCGVSTHTMVCERSFSVPTQARPRPPGSGR